MFKTKAWFVAAMVTVIASAYSYSSNAKELVVAAASNPGGLAVFVAQDKGFFAKNGVDVKVEIRNTGSALLMAAPSPPAIKVSVAASAPAMPPETGESIRARCLVAACSWMYSVVTRSVVDESTMMVWDPTASITASSSTSTSRTSFPVGSMVITMSASFAAAGFDPAAITPPATAREAAQKCQIPTR